MDNTAEVMLWGTRVGAVSWVAEQALGYYQYDQNFLTSGIQIAPLQMPLDAAPFAFPTLPLNTFKGLPGLLADVLPDKFGNRLIDTWLARAGRRPADFNPVERLCYVGTRGMGALEFKPASHRYGVTANSLEISNLVELVNQVLNERTALAGSLTGIDDHEALENILRVGTSAGGARAKAVLAWNPASGEFRSGQADAQEGFEHWLLKFDGVSNNRDKEIADPMGFGQIEFAYNKMALACGIDMMPCRLFAEGGRHHFMTKRFDRTVDEAGATDKLHMQSLCALQHYDFNDPTGYSYEQALLTIRELGLGADALDEQFRRTVFNIVARNQDDHVKNIAFLMNRSGEWALSPAYDVTYSFNPSGDWTSQHQMSVNGKRDGFAIEDLLALAQTASIKRPKAKRIVNNVVEVVSEWLEFASDCGVDADMAGKISRTHRLAF